MALLTMDTRTRMSEDRARAIAADLNLDAEREPAGERWTYRVEQDEATMRPERWSVRAFDEAGKPIAYL